MSVRTTKRRGQHRPTATDASPRSSTTSGVRPTELATSASCSNEDEGVRRAYPPATLERLAEVKRHYDPDTLFRINLNVQPAVK